MTADPAGWICCQLGAREHYAVPRALHRRRRLTQLTTDAWARPGSWAESLGALGFARLTQRYHGELLDAAVRPMTLSLIANEVAWRIQGCTGWDLVIARNNWFQRTAAASFASNAAHSRTFVFAHSYSAEGILREAKQRGWTTVLGQIDPGPRHYQLQQQLSDERPEYGAPPAPPPVRYFDAWRRECDAADHIVVNSDWSRQSLAGAGIDAAKIVSAALPYEPDNGADAFERAYPAAFSAERPMRVLFVGTASVMKGVAELLDGFVSLDDSRVELSLVGGRAMSLPPRIERHPRIRWIGPVDRSSVMEHYRASDVLVFPSHSDGFGMAQVEARGWALPIIASRHCGHVVDDGETGILLDTVSGASIAAALGRAVESPSLLARFSRRMRQCPAPGLDALADLLVALEER